MKSRREFLQRALLSSFIISPFANQVKAYAGTDKLNRNINQKGAQVLSTWNHGMAANDKAWSILSANGDALDAVEEGVKVTEIDKKVLSVGLNGIPDREGVVTLDASIMKGDGSCGSVAFVRQVKHPITLARMVMEKHLMLCWWVKGLGSLPFKKECL